MALEIGLLYASFIPYSCQDIYILDEIISEISLKYWSVWSKWTISLMCVLDFLVKHDAGNNLIYWQLGMLVFYVVMFVQTLEQCELRATCLVFRQLGLTLRTPTPINVAVSVVQGVVTSAGRQRLEHFDRVQKNYPQLSAIALSLLGSYFKQKSQLLCVSFKVRVEYI